MQDDAIDKIVQDAAAQYHPAYNDKAWEGMHTLLDKNLPQKDKDKKWLWLLLPLLVTFIAAGVVWMRQPATETLAAAPAQNTNTGTMQSPAAAMPANEEALKNNTVSNTQGDNFAVPGAPAPATSSISGNAVTVPATVAAVPAPASSVSSPAVNRFTNSRSRTRAIIKPGEVADDLNNLDRATPPPPAKVAPAVAGDTEVTGDQSVAVEKPILPAAPPGEVNKEDKNKLPAANKNTGTAAEKKLPETEKNTASTKTEKAAKRPGRFGDNFAFTLSAGPDYSFVKTSQQGETQLAYGAGIAYTVAGRFTIRAGLYAAKKVYTTDTASYKPKVPVPIVYSIEKIKGDCLVYEVPVSISYNFGQHKKHSWFGSAGISSVFMKRETYSYYYYRSGTLWSKDYTINNENSHLMSILTLSGGYQYNLSRHISLAAEPYYKIPVSGIGYGNLKLKSAGVLFSAIVRPFSKRK
jgi:hypothetical protein